jgi:hypothetical protein
MMIRTFAAAVGLSVAASASLGQGELLYDIDFSEPFHTFGDFVTVDTGAAPRQGFSGYFLTDPADEARVDGVFDLRSMTGGVALFTNVGLSQPLMELENVNGAATQDYDIYTLEFDASIISGSGIVVYFDAPTINRFYIGTGVPDNGIGQITDGSGPGDGTVLAPFTFGELLKVRAEYNTISQRFRVTIDGEVLYQGPVQNEIMTPQWVRFTAQPGAVVDNVRIWGSFEECGSADLNDDGLLDLADVNAFVTSFLGGCE